MRNPYEVLGVPRTASQADIKRKYRALAKENHPDRKPGDKAAVERFKEINAAYDIVGDEKQRARFDKGEIDADGRERVHAGFGGGPWGNTGGPGGSRGGAGGARGGDQRGFEEFGMNFNFDDLFSAFRGGFTGGGAAGARPQAEPSTAGEFEMEVDFLDSAVGGTKRITVDGRSFDVTIPAGIETGQTIRLRDKDVDLRILVTVRPHPFFQRKGDDIVLDLPVSVMEAVRGAKVDVPTVHGSVTLNIPPGSNTGTNLRLKGQGIRRKGKPEGNQMVRLAVYLPDAIDSDVEKTLADWEKRHSYDPRKRLRG
jgi:DnaJ-class molecular chaperone